MKRGFWGKIKKPFFVLAPMEDVTDMAFRAMFLRYGKPDVLWTEFTSADALAHPEGRIKVEHRLQFERNEACPIVAQIFGARPANMTIAARILQEMGFDGIDINMGCPEKNVQKQGSCAALIQTPALATDIVRAVQKGAGSLPVSVKTRIGYNQDEIDTWIPHLLSLDIATLTVHLRTKKEMSDVPAHWDSMSKIVALRDKHAPETLIIGNGDVSSIAEGRSKALATGCDGVMYGRAVFGNPWFFAETGEQTTNAKLVALQEHITLFNQYFFGEKNFVMMKKHFKAYVHGFDGASTVREMLMQSDTAEDAIRIIDKILTK